MKPEGLGGVAGKVGYYDRGLTPFYACAADQRFSYCLYVPELPASGVYRLVVLIHGTNRPAERYRDGFREFGDAHGAIIMAPLFPANITGPGDLSSYKRLRDSGIAYDLILLAMIDEVRARYPVADKCLMHGFSGGGHFTHRFLMAHPERLAGASVGAAGVVTLLDDRVDWILGTRNFGEVFGAPPDREAIARVPVHICVGDQDTETWEIAIRPGGGWWQPGGEWQETATRIERAERLRDSLEAAGCTVDFDLVPGVAHITPAVWPAVQAWMAKLFAEGRA